MIIVVLFLVDRGDSLDLVAVSKPKSGAPFQMLAVSFRPLWGASH